MIEILRQLICSFVNIPNVISSMKVLTSQSDIIWKMQEICELKSERRCIQSGKSMENSIFLIWTVNFRKLETSFLKGKSSKINKK